MQEDIVKSEKKKSIFMVMSPMRKRQIEADHKNEEVKKQMAIIRQMTSHDELSSSPSPRKVTLNLNNNNISPDEMVLFKKNTLRDGH